MSRNVLMYALKMIIKPFCASFLGSRFWLFREANLESGYPQELVDYGRDIPYDRIDTAIWWEPSGYTYFFQGDR